MRGKPTKTAKYDEMVGYLCVLCGTHNVLKQIEHKKRESQHVLASS